MNQFIDTAVDKAAIVAKGKVKSMLAGGGGGGDSKKQGKSGGGLGALGGIGGLFPSASDGGKKEASKGGGLFDGLKAPAKEVPRSEPSGGASAGASGGASAGASGGASAGASGGASKGAENSDFDSALDELAGF